MKKIIVLGAGMIGNAIVRDLSKKYIVCSADINEKALKKLPNSIGKVKVDLSDKTQIEECIEAYDLVVSAVPGFMGFKTMEAVISAGKKLVDISFMPEDATQLNKLAVENDVTVLMDFGVAPGIPNIIAGYYYTKMKIDQFSYMIGGLPKVRKFPFEYKAPFSPCDVIEEYTRPARMVVNGQIVTAPAMSDLELVQFDNVGTLEAFNTDGLRSLLHTLPLIPNMKEKTLRYPGHSNYIKALMETGFFDKEKISINGASISPIDFTSQILFKDWYLEPDEKEFTAMKIEITGSLNGTKTEIGFLLFDEYDEENSVSSMARTTGYTATSGVELLMRNAFNERGVFPPEKVGKYEICYNIIIKHLEERNIFLNKI